MTSTKTIRHDMLQRILFRDFNTPNVTIPYTLRHRFTPRNSVFWHVKKKRSLIHPCPLRLTGKKIILPFYRPRWQGQGALFLSKGRRIVVRYIFGDSHHAYAENDFQFIQGTHLWGGNLWKVKRKENVLTIRERSASCKIFGVRIPWIHAPTSFNEYAD